MGKIVSFQTSGNKPADQQDSDGKLPKTAKRKPAHKKPIKGHIDKNVETYGALESSSSAAAAPNQRLTRSAVKRCSLLADIGDTTEPKDVKIKVKSEFQEAVIRNAESEIPSKRRRNQRQKQAQEK